MNITMSPLRYAGLVLALLGSLLAAGLGGWGLWSSHRLKAVQALSERQEEALRSDALAFQNIRRVDTATASVLNARRAIKAEDLKHKEVKDAELAKALAAEPDWASEHVPASVLNSLRSN